MCIVNSLFYVVGDHELSKGVEGGGASNGCIMVYSSSTIWGVSKKLNSRETMRGLVRQIEII